MKSQQINFFQDSGSNCGQCREIDLWQARQGLVCGSSAKKKRTKQEGEESKTLVHDSLSLFKITARHKPFLGRNASFLCRFDGTTFWPKVCRH